MARRKVLHYSPQAAAFSTFKSPSVKEHGSALDNSQCTLEPSTSRLEGYVTLRALEYVHPLKQIQPSGIKCPPHGNGLWRTPKVVYITNRGSQYQLWMAVDPQFS